MKNYITVGIAALGLIIAAFLGNTIKNRNKSQNTISVTGLGAKEIYFRSYYMECFFFQSGYQLQEAYNNLATDRQMILDYLKSKGVKSEEIVFSAVDIQNNMYTGYRC